MTGTCFMTASNDIDFVCIWFWFPFSKRNLVLVVFFSSIFNFFQKKIIRFCIFLLEIFRFDKSRSIENEWQMHQSRKRQIGKRDSVKYKKFSGESQSNSKCYSWSIGLVNPQVECRLFRRIIWVAIIGWLAFASSNVQTIETSCQLFHQIELSCG